MYKVHIKNNHFAPDTFPNTAEGEAVFTISRERFDVVAKDYPDVASKMDVFFDWDTDNFVSSMADTEVLICWNLPTENLAEIAPNLKWIHIIGAGGEHLTPMTWLPKGVMLTNNKGVHAAKGGEFGIMSILMLHNHMPAIVTNKATATYDSIYSTPIAGKVVAVIGVGSIGKAVAAHAQRMGLHVIGVTRHGNKIPEVDEVYPVSELDEVLPRADYVFVVTPLTEDTRNLLDRRRLGLLKQGAGLVNIGRAAVVDYEALVDKLNDGSVSGAILDVFDPEPLPADSKFWKVKNLIVAPHISADDGNAYVPMTLKVVFENMGRLIRNEALQNQVNTELGY
ncbi:MAG: D-2-hydroxyacid dehydrogenase [Gammaproteobacteria bacterium]|nr:D-2-hydroxyacid dehydrogenase [Gammaproteobacteria bacterium]